MLDSIVLVITVCMLNNPTNCETKEIDGDFPTPIACLMAGQTEAVKWLYAHPAYRIDSWKCGKKESSI